jgi:predicted ATPase/CYTH domain-containing protein
MRSFPDITGVVVTGGPCGGKTTFLARARQWLEDRGCYVVVVGEAAREVLASGVVPDGQVITPFAFQTILMRYVVDRRCAYLSFVAGAATSKPKVVLFDRAEMDARAFVDDSIYYDALEEADVEHHTVRDNYDGVIHLVSAADGATAYYTTDSERKESIEQAAEQDERLQMAWNGHPRRMVIDNRTDFETKMLRALKSLARVCHMPEPQEIERKWHVREYSELLAYAEQHGVAAHILQTYLTAPIGLERRVRQREVGGVTTWYYTEKAPTYLSGVRIERERQIGVGEYIELLREASPDHVPILKTRYTWTHAGRVMELDVVHRPLDLVVLEVEVPAIDEEVELPPGAQYEEVTNNPVFKSEYIARK